MNEEQRQLLGGISPGEFLNAYWQKKPYLIRQAIHGFSTFISINELLQLAADDNVESRIVIEKDGEYPWQVLPGPIHDSVISSLPDSHWSLLVQGLELHNLDAASLLQRFSFIPNWRVDDLMISYARNHGSVGPHLDSYDVFLLQTLGRRRWRISYKHYGEDDFLSGTDLRVIGNFDYDEEWDLEPGDMLYLPPGIAHHGIALGECMTCSVGFRAPTRHELLTAYLESIYNSGNDIQYGDPELEIQEQPGEISQECLHRIKEIMQSCMQDSGEIDRWFGSYITSLPEPYIPETPSGIIDLESFKKKLQKTPRLLLRHGVRTAFLKIKNGLLLFVNGREYLLPEYCLEVVHGITGARIIDCSKLDPGILEGCAETLLELYNTGALVDSG